MSLSRHVLGIEARSPVASTDYETKVAFMSRAISARTSLPLHNNRPTVAPMSRQGGWHNDSPLTQDRDSGTTMITPFPVDLSYLAGPSHRGDAMGLLLGNVMGRG